MKPTSVRGTLICVPLSAVNHLLLIQNAAEVKRGFRNQASVSLNLGRPGENRYEYCDKTSCFLLTGSVSDAEAFEVPGDVESTANLFVLPEKRGNYSIYDEHFISFGIFSS